MTLRQWALIALARAAVAVRGAGLAPAFAVVKRRARRPAATSVPA